MAHSASGYQTPGNFPQKLNPTRADTRDRNYSAYESRVGVVASCKKLKDVKTTIVATRLYRRICFMGNRAIAVWKFPPAGGGVMGASFLAFHAVNARRIEGNSGWLPSPKP